MSYFNIPGFYKLFFPKQNVQTKYQSLHQIPIITIDKQIAYIPKNQPQPKLIFIHAKKLKENQDILAKFVQLKKKNYEVYIIPEQNQYQNFVYLNQNTPKGLTLLGIVQYNKGKMILNGEKQHPLIKFLKSECDKFYDFRMLGASPISQEIGAFVKNTKNRVKYYKKKDFDNFINSQLGIIQNPPIANLNQNK